MLIGIIILTFVLTSGAAYLLLGGVARQPNLVQERLQGIGEVRQDIELFPPHPGGRSGEGSASARANRPDLLPALTRLLSGSAMGDSLRASILRSGMRLRPSEFLISCAGCAVGGAIACFLFTHQTLFLAVGGGIGFYLPFMVMGQKTGARRRSLENQIPEALTLIASSMRSGYSFLRAVSWSLTRCLRLCPRSSAGCWARSNWVSLPRRRWSGW